MARDKLGAVRTTTLRVDPARRPQTSPDWWSWSELVGKRCRSHFMRHTYAVSLLSGW